jgi:hypothetical protein
MPKVVRIEVGGREASVQRCPAEQDDDVAAAVAREVERNARVGLEVADAQPRLARALPSSITIAPGGVDGMRREGYARPL